MHGPIDELSGIDLSELEAGIGSRSFQRGRGYVRGGRVARVEWDSDGLTLIGSVVGTALYETTAYFADADGSLAFEDGECTCPVGYNCKHVAAIAIAAAGAGSGTQRGRRRPRPATMDGPVWERSLRALIDAPVARPGSDRWRSSSLWGRPCLAVGCGCWRG